MKRRDLIGSGGLAMAALGVPVAAAGATPSGVVSSRADAASLAASMADGAILSLSDGGRSGFFEVISGTAPDDPLQGLYIQGTGKYLARRWDGLNARPEWFGAAINDEAVDSYPGIAACIALTGMCALGKGTYHCSRSPLADLPAYAVVKGQGALHTGIIVNHPADHLISQRGTFPGSYLGGANLQVSASRAGSPRPFRHRPPMTSPPRTAFTCPWYPTRSSRTSTPITTWSNAMPATSFRSTLTR